MKDLRLNKNANWYMVRFTDFIIDNDYKTVELYNYFTQEKYIINDKKFFDKINLYIVGYYLAHQDTITRNLNKLENIDTFVNMRQFNKKYDTIKNR